MKLVFNRVFPKPCGHGNVAFPSDVLDGLESSECIVISGTCAFCGEATILAVHKNGIVKLLFQGDRNTIYSIMDSMPYEARVYFARIPNTPESIVFGYYRPDYAELKQWCDEYAKSENINCELIGELPTGWRNISKENEYNVDSARN